MASVASGRGRNRRLVYKVKSSRASDGSVVYSIFSCIDDVEHHRHRRNPFDPKYIQAALSSFDEIGKVDCRSVATREEVEAASTSVHVRMELIKSMKDGLVKLTSEAVKHCKGVAKKALKSKSTLDEEKQNFLKQASRQQEADHVDDFFKNDDFHMYQKKFGQACEALQVKTQMPGSLGQVYDKSVPKGSVDLGLLQVIKDLDVCLNENSNFVSEDELCFNIGKETMDTLINVLQRTQLDIRPELSSEADFADLSPFKGSISPITKDLILDFEDSRSTSQSEENMENNAPESCQVMTKNVQKEYIKSDCGVFNEVCTDGFQTKSNHIKLSSLPEQYQSASSPVRNEPFNALTSDHAHGIMKPIGASAADSDAEDISSPTLNNQGSMDISSEDDVMDGISDENLEDEIEDGDQMDVGISVHFCLQNQDIDKYILFRRQMKRSKNLWLVQNPEKLLLPDAGTVEHELKADDIESIVQNTATAGKIFQKALSRLEMDLVDHYKLLQDDSSKIPGSLHFDAQAADWDLIDISSTAYVDACGQESQNRDLEKLAKQNKADDFRNECEDQESSQKERQLPCSEETGNTISPQTPRRAAFQKSSLLLGEACWDSFSWSTGLAAAAGQSIDHLESQKSIRKSGTEDTLGNFISSAQEISLLCGGMDFCDHASTLEPYAALKIAEAVTLLQPNWTSSESIQSSGVLDHDMEAASQDEDFHQAGRQKSLLSATVENSTLSCLSSETTVHDLSEIEGSVKDSEVETHQIQKKCLHLEDLITGAVMAECQLHQKTFSHFDLEPLSRLLAMHMASTYQKHKTKVFVFKDFVDACGCAPEITLQRYFVALLSATHQHNMGNSKDMRLDGLQILLEGGVLGRLSELTINLSPSQSAAFD